MIIRKRKLLLVLSAALTVLFIYFTVHTDWTVPVWLGSRNKNFAVMMSRRASPDRFIVLALVDASFADMAINLYETSFRPNAIENFLFVGAGRRVCEILLNVSLPCFHYVEDKATEVASIYKSPDFIRKMNIRTNMILDALEVGFTVLHTDLDVIFMKNPIPELKTIMLTADIAAMLDGCSYNAGFTVVRPSWFSRKIYERTRAISRISPKTDDQTALNLAINRANRLYKSKGFSSVTLDKKRYLCGLEYFERGERLFASNCSQCVVVHNNWIVSREAKIYRFKEHHMWLYDKDGYYTSDRQRYLSYENPPIWNDAETGTVEELEALKTALAYGELLNRVVILPRFHCISITSASDIRVTTEAAVSAMAQECPLNSLLNITAFDAVFGNRYRENSFLSHPLVPDAVKRDQSEPFLVLDDKSNFVQGNWKFFNRTEGVQLITFPQGSTLWEEEVRVKLSVENRVLRFHSLYNVTRAFLGEERYEKFELKVMAAFLRGSYRQL